jgi:hypothetical protein
MNLPLTAHPFALTAERVRRWVLLRRWVSWLQKTARWVVVGLVALALLLVGTGQMVWLVLALAGLIVWLGGVGLWVWQRMPGDYSVWALWDQAAGRREAFAAAWWFETHPDDWTSEAAQHWEAQRLVLPEALLQLERDLPLPSAKWCAAPVAALTALLVTAFLLPGVQRDPVLTAEMEQAAVVQAERLKLEKPDAEALAALAEEEREKLAALLAAAAEDLKNSEGKSLRQVMAGLEQRAREAEHLASRLGQENEVWASPELTAALRQQADTADLGDAVADRAAESAAKAAEALAGQLDEASRKAELAERLSEVLAEATAQAQAEDAERLVGGPVLEAGKKMEAKDVSGSAEAMRRLAESLREVAQRELAQEELQRLAESLREAGAKVANGGAENAMQALAGAGEQGPAGAVGQEGRSEMPQVGQQSGNGQTPAQQMMMAPPGLDSPQQGAGEGGAGEQGEAGNQQPLLGMTEPGQQGQSPPGQGDGQDKPRLLAPVPGQPQGKPEGPAVLMPGQSGDPGMTLQMPGSGLPPGTGSAELKGEETEAQETARQSLVEAQSNQEGSSRVRQVQGGAPGEEQATRGASAAAVEFLEAQEKALDESALPVARREQVRRYFNELRRRLENEP